MQLFPSSYTFDIKRDTVQSTDLVVTVSSAASAFAFYMSDFARPTLYVADGSYSYYTDKPDILASALISFMRDKQFKRAVFVGHSKGGFGAILLSYLCARQASELSFGSVVFSPQIRLWPRTEALSFPSYQRLVSASQSDIQIRRGMEKFGSLPELSAPNLLIDTYCGRGSREDKGEVDLLAGSSVRKNFVPTSSHMSHLPYVVDTTNAEALRKVLGKAYSQNAKIEGESPATIAERTFLEMSLMPRQKHIIELVSDLFEEMRA